MGDHESLDSGEASAHTVPPGLQLSEAFEDACPRRQRHATPVVLHFQKDLLTNTTAAETDAWSGLVAILDGVVDEIQNHPYQLVMVAMALGQASAHLDARSGGQHLRREASQGIRHHLTKVHPGQAGSAMPLAGGIEQTLSHLLQSVHRRKRMGEVLPLGVDLALLGQHLQGQ